MKSGAIYVQNISEFVHIILRFLNFKRKIFESVWIFWSLHTVFTLHSIVYGGSRLLRLWGTRGRFHDLFFILEYFRSIFPLSPSDELISLF